MRNSDRPADRSAGSPGPGRSERRPPDGSSRADRWSLPVALDPHSGEPLFLQIARGIAYDIRRGRLRRRARLPGSRSLATTLRVHRNTVLAAYAELAAEGWIETAQARGTFVSGELPEVERRRIVGGASGRGGAAERPPRAAFSLAPDRGLWLYQRPPVRFVMPDGLPDLRLVPTAALARAYRRALRDPASQGLAYGDPRGHPRLRAALAEMLAATRGLAIGADDVLVTRGSQMALELIARCLLVPGDVVAVEDPGYRTAWQAFGAHGARLVPLPVDASGLDVNALDALARTTRVRAVYTTPHHQYPTTVTLSAGRRLSLLELARSRGIAVVEDDYTHEFHYDGRPVLPLASSDRSGSVIYVGTLTKILAPGLRLGYMVAPPDLLQRAASERFSLDIQGDHVLEQAIAELFDDGEVQRHARRARRIYEARRDFMVGRLRKRLGGALTFDPPSGGIALWASVAPDIDVPAWTARALELGVFVAGGRHFSFANRPLSNMRLGFAGFDTDELTEATDLLAQALRDLRRR
jgi:GntR family transcriptional regulator/MocR family aminotransferase